MAFYDWFSDAAPASKERICYHIEGFLECAYFHNAVELGDLVKKRASQVQVDVKATERAQWSERIQQLKKEIPGSQEHRTSPFIYEGCSTTLRFIGGYTDFFNLARERHG
ncbi:hypothetical protein K493DRAFT_408141 [Basidiobolus meristosporus CBS 931.73]|uniref:Uncharacterized protein n=1 Tax=Basidiobolus meristosporus CBS 931.73 TaxID=1314790 RepID=A0A1Y1Y7T1_9FUNG|nr:hypothetical protein K493DRAFT_408141 [Basidiobolus meristosporus CBS 931.73]|eukprot:ORX94053.1 hypothetical protein K493DRAFT_408141 [Basidiobolus meristosporus CBS 931.73]